MNVLNNFNPVTLIREKNRLPLGADFFHVVGAALSCFYLLYFKILKERWVGKEYFFPKSILGFQFWTFINVHFSKVLTLWGKKAAATA